MINSIEWATMQQKVFQALEAGKNTLQEINSTMSLEEVEKLMEDSQEAIEHQEAISELLGGKLTTQDDEAVLKELEELEENEEKEEVPEEKTGIQEEEKEVEEKGKAEVEKPQKTQARKAQTVKKF